MYSHSTIWGAIDAIARAKGWSLPKLAVAAGLHDTALNQSKRFTRDGKAHWPSLETLAKLLSATGVSLADFAQIIAVQQAAERGEDCPAAEVADEMEA